MGFPRVVPHSDGSGVVEAVGEGVDPARLGERVWLWNAQWERAMGTCAERVALPADMAVALPEGASLEHGACLGIPAQTAHACVFGDGPVEGRTVLVSGGGGAAGAYAVTMARLGGARVIATAGSAATAARAREAGAHEVVDRHGDAAAAVQALAPAGVDRIVEVEFGANLPLIQAVLKPNGTVAAYGSAALRQPVLPFYPLMFNGTTLRMVLVYILPPEARARAVADITRWLAEGALSHRVAAVRPLERTAEAHEMVEQGRRVGSVLVEVSPGL
jgi:NADPH:quinone reductase-like Zn-dependent oxidoreductase